MIKEHDRVVLTAAILAAGLEPGDVGTVVHASRDGEAYEVEFVALDGHTAAVFVSLERKAGLEEVRDAFRTFSGPPQQLGLPSAPAHPTVLFDAPDRPQPRLDINVERGMATLVGRVRPCDLMGWKFIVPGHNTIRGAAGAAILNAELLLAQGMI